MKNDESAVRNSSQPAELRLIRLKEVLAICGKSRSSVYDAMALLHKSVPAAAKLGHG
ncbi:AlpA family phage regulatory protein [Massilia sp. TW-1]|uniref:AlpA family phage regulatory protein n=1 Tax=Telluria antibiotica TaxID=2717319 RepID=A0ABX0PKS9_9BURK|nr:AlpA family phage regulatory protein [Telluria antibiotica]NIA56998.1 AlpA family phage regulatory protein [Telluria antibiotica]